MKQRDDEFYVGYLDRAPPSHARRARFFVVVTLLFAVLAALVLVAGQRPFSRSVHEFGVNRTFEGFVREEPYPMLTVLRPGLGTTDGRYSHYYLTVFGKFAAQEALSGLDGRRVRVEGELIYRDGQTMIQIVPDTLETIDDAGESAGPPTDVGTSLGEATLVGEIVDSKCFLGVMKPGELKPHRSCAARCISGGVPPVLVVRDDSGRATYYLLVSPEDRAVNREVLSFVAEPVEIVGEVVRLGNLLLLRADPASYRRL